MQQQDEKTAVKEFLKNSKVFLDMNQIAANSQPTSQQNGVPDKYSQEQQIINDLNNAKTFADIMDVSKRISEASPGEVLFLKVGSWFSPTASFGNKLRQLREDAVTAAVKSGHPLQPVSDTPQPTLGA